MFEKILHKISDKLLGQELYKTDSYRAQQEQMVEEFTNSFKVFRKPYFSRYMEDYKGEPKYFTIKGHKLFKIPLCLTCTDWKITKISYEYRLGEIVIHHLPRAEAVRWGQVIKITTKTPVTNTTNPQYYWQSLLEFTFGQGAHKGSLRKTIEKLGKSSMGVQFDDYNPHIYELSGDDYMNMPSFGNSMYFVVDKSYIKPDHWKEYDFATESYNKNESPMMI